MTKKTFDKKRKELQESYVHWAEIRDKAIRELKKIIKRTHKLEDRYYKEHPESTGYFLSDIV